MIGCLALFDLCVACLTGVVFFLFEYFAQLSFCLCACECLFVWLLMCVHVWFFGRLFDCGFVCVVGCLLVCVVVCVFFSLYVRLSLFACLCVCMYACMYVCVFLCGWLVV